MAQKRKAQEAFGKTNGQLSAFAAARLKRSNPATCIDQGVAEIEHDVPRLEASLVATTPYDGHHSDGSMSRSNSAVVTPAVTPPRSGTSLRLSTFRKTSRNVLRDDGEGLELSMAANETVTLTGEYDMVILEGTATIYGAVLNPISGWQRVFAPSVQALPVITARKSPTIVRLTSVKSSLQRLERLSPLYRNIWTTDSVGRSFAFLPTTGDDPHQRSLSALEMDSTAQKVLTQIAGKSEEQQGTIRATTIGSKSSGKSTFNRQICNALLTKNPGRRCLYLDLDPGQPEFGPPGQVSLVEVRAPILGPAFTHTASKKSKNYKLLVSHTLAATSFKDDPEHYVACVQDMVDGCRDRLRGNKAEPLVVNYCGWVTGLGLAVLADLYGLIGITDTIVMDGDSTLSQMAQANSENCYRLSRAPVKQSLRTPAELRAMQTIAYFHFRPATHPKWNAKPVNTYRPWVVSYDFENPGIVAVMSYGQSVHPDFLSEVLDGSLLAIVAIDTGEDLQAALATSVGRNQSPENSQGEVAPDVSLDSIQRTLDGLPYVASSSSGFLRPLDPSKSACHGLALIRAIDSKRKELHLVTPASEEEIAQLMTKRVILVRGNFDSPEWAYLEDLYAAEKGGVVDVEDRPWVTRKEMVGIEGAVWRLRHPPTASQVAMDR